jgi:hypothetical protein
MGALRELGPSAARLAGARLQAREMRGPPADADLSMAEEVDVLAVGSRR